MTFDDMLFRVLPFVLGCPDETAIDHLRDAARRFCQRTRCWKLQTEPIATVAGQTTYQLGIDDGQEVLRLEGASVGTDDHFRVYSAAEARAMLAHGTYDRFLFLDGPFDLRLNPAPSVGGESISVELVVQPSLTATYWPDDLAEHVPVIADGAIASIAGLPRQQWTDPKLQADKDGWFNSQAARAAIRVTRNKSTPTRRVTSRFL